PEALVSPFRRSSVVTDVYYPVDPCRVGHNGEHRALPHLHNYKEDASSIASSQQLDTNPAAKDRFHTHGRDPNGEFKRWNHSGWKLIVDKTNLNAQLDKDLVLNFYDFVRICDSLSSGKGTGDQAGLAVAPRSVPGRT
ncbi:unnamed protein product, partial [Rhizoctonia solani]